MKKKERKIKGNGEFDKIKFLFQKYWPFLAYSTISLFFLFPTISKSGIPFKYDWFWPVFNMKEIWGGLFDKSSFGLVSAIGKYPTLIIGLPGIFNISSSLCIKIFLLLIHIFSACGFYRLIIHRNQSKIIAFFSGLAYAFSPYIFIRTIIGFDFSLIAYASMPYFIDIYFSDEKKTLSKFALLGLLFSFIFSQIQAGILLVALIVINIFLPINKDFILSKTKIFVFLIISILIVNFPWIFIGLFLNASSIEVVNGGQAVTLKFIADLPHSLRNILMLSDHHVTSGYFYPLARKPIVLLAYAIIYLVAFFSIFDKKNRSLVLSLTILSLLALPFTIGPNKPFTSIYAFFFEHIPQIAIFRETYHLEFILAFSLIFLFAVGAGWIIQKFKAKKISAILIYFLLVAPLFVLIFPYFTFNYAGYFRLQTIPPEYNELRQYFVENSDVCKKIYYPPNLGFIYFKNDTSPDALNSDVLAFATGVPYLKFDSSVLSVQNNEMYYRNKITSQFLETKDNGEFANLMQEGGIDCLVVRNDIGTKYYKVSKLWLESDETIKDKWFNEDMLSLAKNKENLKLVNRFGDKIYIFKSQIPNPKSQFLKSEESTGQSATKQFSGLEILQLPLTDWADNFDWYQDGWSRGRYSFWRKKLFADLEQDFVYTTKENAVLEGKIDQSGSYELWARYLDGGTEGNIKLQISNDKFQITKGQGEEKFVWKKLGDVQLNGKTDINITNISGENAIADLVLVKN